MADKVYVFTEIFGEYDSAEKSIQAILLGPEKIDLRAMRKEYCDYLEQYKTDLKTQRKELPPKERRKLKWEPKQFYEWVALTKEMKKLDFEEIDW